MNRVYLKFEQQMTNHRGQRPLSLELACLEMTVKDDCAWLMRLLLAGVNLILLVNILQLSHIENAQLPYNFDAMSIHVSCGNLQFSQTLHVQLSSTTERSDIPMYIYGVYVQRFISHHSHACVCKFLEIFSQLFGMCTIPVGVTAIDRHNDVDFVTSSRVFTAGRILMGNGVAIILFALWGLVASSWKNKTFLGVVSECIYISTLQAHQQINFCVNDIHYFVVRWIKQFTTFIWLFIQVRHSFTRANSFPLFVSTFERVFISIAS